MKRLIESAGVAFNTRHVLGRILEPFRKDCAARACAPREDAPYTVGQYLADQEEWSKQIEAEEEGGPWADGIWLRLADGQLSSWCGCVEPGKKVLACGHCGCGNSDLCWEWIVDGSDQLVVKRRKATCA